MWCQDPGTARHGTARQVRVHLDDALRHYSKAEELYVESRTALPSTRLYYVDATVPSLASLYEMRPIPPLLYYTYHFGAFSVPFCALHSCAS